MSSNYDSWLKVVLPGTVKPIFWPKPAYELDPKDSANNGFINQDFLVWMRRAALPDFRKLYRRITEGDYAEGLPTGNYSLEIAYSILIHITDSGGIIIWGMATYVCLTWVLCLNIVLTIFTSVFYPFFHHTNKYLFLSFNIWTLTLSWDVHTSFSVFCLFRWCMCSAGYE